MARAKSGFEGGSKMCKKVICLVSFVLVLGLAVGVANADYTSGLVGYYPLDEGAGNIAHDMSGNGHDGTLPNSGVTWITSAVINGGINFDGTASSNVKLGTWNPAEGTGQLSLALWINWAQSGILDQGLISKRDDWSADGMMFGLRVRNSNNIIRFHHAGGAVLDSPANVLTPLIREWAHVGVTFDGATARIYLNGQEVAAGAFFLANKTTAEMRIGAYSSNSQTFNGDMDEVRIYNRALTQDDMLEVMLPPSPGQASKPDPADGQTDLPRDNVVLSWRSGDYANKHDVYFGADFDDVNEATAGADPASVYMGAQSQAAYALDRLEFGRTYYWRVDEVNAPPNPAVFKGNVWSFSVEPVGYPIASEDITATASSSNSADESPDNTIDGSGLGADDLHSMLGTDMWLSDAEAQGAWIQYEFDKVYKLHEMWVWNSNQMVESTIGFGLRAVTIEYSTDGSDWIELAGVPEFAQAPGADGYAHNTTVDLAGVAAKYVRLTATSNWGGILPKYGLSEVRFFYIPTYASRPDPISGATGVSIGTIDEPVDVTLDFRAGREAAMHDVYLSTDEQAVIDGTAPVTALTESGYGPLPLDIGRTYYWRVDEVNDAEVPTIWQGDVWSLATQEYFILDDFEDYNNYPPDEIFNTWTDGWGIATNGALVAYGDDVVQAGGDYVETTIVHEGSQAMPYFYDNSVGNSEATFKLSSQRRDWTIRGIGSLSLWFRGYPASVGGFTESPAGTYTLTGAGWNIWDTSDGFHFAYKTLNGPGSIVAKVESVENTNAWAKGGVMVRDTLEPDSANGALFFSPAEAIGFQRRTTTGEETTKTQQDGIKAPQWVKLEVEASGAVRASYSADGNTWTELDRDAIRMDAPFYIGLAVTSRNAALACEAVFSNVRIDGAVSGEWRSKDIGILSNNPERMYVALANSGGTPVEVPHPDPNATQTTEWTEWNIDLKQFADQGVNLADVDTLSIGFGDRDNPQPGTSGKMYFDDIRLHAFREPEPEVDLTGILLDVTDGLVGYYPLDEGTGNTAQDASGNGHDGTLPDIGVTWISSAVINGGINIDGTTGSDIKLGTWDPSEGTGQLSVGAWIRWAGSGNQNQSLMSKRDGGWSADAMMFDFRITLSDTGIRLYRAGSAGAAVSDVLAPFIGEWAHVAVTFDGTTARLYLNGQEIGSGAFSLGNGATTGLRIGSYNNNSPTFNGDLDEVRIYNRALTPDEFSVN